MSKAEISTRLTIALCTAHRPKMLAACLTSIAEQHRPANCDLAIALVENTELGTCEDVARRCLDGTGIDLAYEVEHRKGIPFARNRSVEMALAQGADWIAFIDDDETLNPGWLEAMIAHARSEAAQVFTGPVDTIFPNDAPAWLEAPRSYHTRKVGDVLSHAATNNTIVARSVFESEGAPRFDTDFALTGGSDTEFFKRMTAAGYRIVWITDAVVSEELPAERLKLSWHLQRAYRVASNEAMILMKRRGRLHCWIKLGHRVIGRTLSGASLGLLAAAEALFDRRRGTVRGFQALKKFARARGLATGLIGRKPTPYAQVEGS